MSTGTKQGNGKRVTRRKTDNDSSDGVDGVDAVYDTKTDTTKCDVKVSDGEQDADALDDGMTSDNKDSVVNFDRTDVPKWETMKVNELTDEELLKVVVVRGESKKNPVLSGGCKRVLKQINGERFPRRPQFMRGSGRRPPMNLSSSGGRPQRFGNTEQRFGNGDRQEGFEQQGRTFRSGPRQFRGPPRSMNRE